VAELDIERIIAGTSVDEAVWELRPDYRVGLLVVDGLEPGESDATSEAMLQEAEASARAALASGAVTDIPHVAAWREAYQAFGAKPSKYRSSVEALLRRAEGGLPRVNRLTDVYNAVSVKHQIPLGGEDLRGYVGLPQLVRATGGESFDTFAAGEPVVEHVDAGEVVWRDDEGVTCRRWNWRQCRRTQLRGDTTTALFILDVLAPVADSELDAALDALTAALEAFGPEVRTARRVISPLNASAPLTGKRSLA